MFGLGLSIFLICLYFSTLHLNPVPVTETSVRLGYYISPSEAEYEHWLTQIVHTSDGHPNDTSTAEYSDRRIYPRHANMTPSLLPHRPWKPGGAAAARSNGTAIINGIDRLMRALDFPWWLTNSGLLQLTRGSAITDPDFDVAYLPHLEERGHYSKCAEDRNWCTSTEMQQIQDSMVQMLKKKFPSHGVKTWGMPGHFTLLPTAQLGGKLNKLVDFAPVHITPDRTSVAYPSHVSECPRKYGGKGWPCTLYPVATVFPLGKCRGFGYDIPCPVDSTLYNYLSNQQEYVKTNTSQCHGCTNCLLWGGDNSVNYVDNLTAWMMLATDFGYVTMLELSKSLVQDGENYISCRNI